MSSKKTILFITHDTTLTGAPILLLNLIKLIKEETNFKCRLIVKNDIGVLKNEFESIVDTLVWKKSKATSKKNYFIRKVNILINYFLQVNVSTNKQIQIWIDESDIIFSNTITNGDFLGFFNFSKEKKIISYIHELEIASHYYTNKYDIEILKSKSTKFIVPSKVVANHLVQNIGIHASLIHSLNYYIPKNNTTNNFEIRDCTPFFEIGIIGTLDWRKGCELLTTVVAKIFKMYPNLNLRFCWQGVNFKSIEYQRIVYELKILGLSDKVIFKSPTQNVENFYQQIDMLLLLSKEDPYPLVVLEAASFSKPTICFEKVTGAEEFVAKDAGSVIPFLDIDCLINEIYVYINSEQLLREKGQNAFLKYHKLHNNKNLIVDQFIKMLDC